MIEANLGAVNPDLVLGARNAVETCLGIRPGEKVVLIADEPSREVAASLAHALALQQAAWTGCLIEDIAPRPLSGAPDEVLEALEAADVGILCMKPLPGALPARMAIVSIVERRQIRYAHMVGVTPEIMQQGMRTDYTLVDRLSDRLRQRLHGARSLRVRTDAGTSFTAVFDPSLEWVKTSGLIDRKSTRLNSSHGYISYAVFCLKKKKNNIRSIQTFCRKRRAYWRRRLHKWLVTHYA